MRRHRLGLCCAIVLLAAVAAPSATAVASNWNELRLPPPMASDPFGPPLNGVSCPGEDLCVAVGGINTLAFSQDPTGGVAKWHVVGPQYPVGPGKTCIEGEPHCPDPGGRLKAISCASESFCAAASYEGYIYVSTDPTGGADAWTPTVINEPGGHGATHLTAISCPLPSFCAAVSGGYKAPGRVLTSPNPIAGQWQAIQLGDELDLRGISCGTPSFCVAVAREGRLFTSTNPTGGASAWTEVGTPGGPGDLEGLDCLSTVFCAAGNLTGNVLTSTEPSGDAATWREADAGGSVQITDISCPTVSRCAAVDNNGDILISTDPTGGAGSWRFGNLVPFKPTENLGQPPRNALFGSSCASTDLCVLVGVNGRIFTSADPFSGAIDAAGQKGGQRDRPRPRTILVFAEHFWKVAITRHRRARARFRFYSPSKVAGFECKRDDGRYRRCRSPLRYWATQGRHTLHVRAIGPTGLRGPAAIKGFRVEEPRGHEAIASGLRPANR